MFPESIIRNFQGILCHKYGYNSVAHKRSYKQEMLASKLRNNYQAISQYYETENSSCCWVLSVELSQILCRCIMLPFYKLQSGIPILMVFQKC